MSANQIKAQEIVSQLKPGTVVKAKWGTETVAELRGKRVYFADGTFEDMRSMFHYTIISA